jgi:energy-coupling factor transporter ATP-binding protein EcfA2
MGVNTIEQEIVEWSATRPPWQRVLMRRLARGEALGEADLSDLADRLAQTSAPQIGEPLTRADLPGGQAVAAEKIVLRGIRDLAHVNALIPKQTLDFARSGITIVYGDNGSGKSGYARLLKAVVRARDREDVRTDIFADKPDELPSATLLVERAGTPDEISWPTGNVDELGSAGFYDEACGDKYLTTDTEISYRPSALSVLDGLIRACDGVRAALDKRLVENARRAALLPELSSESPAGRFLASLSATSELAQLDALCKLDPDVDEQIKTLAAEEVNLRTLDPAKERARLLLMATKLERLATHQAGLVAAIGPKIEKELPLLHARLRAAEAAASAASVRTFEGEPLGGVGSPVWMILWDAARAYAVDGAHIDGAFPDTSSGARCVLCHQELGTEAADRLRRFESFVRDNVQATLAAARRAWTEASAGLAAVVCEPADIMAILDDLQEAHAPLTTAARQFIACAAARLGALVAAGKGETWSLVEPPPLPAATGAATATATALRQQANAVETRDHEQHLRTVSAKRRALEDAKKLAASKDALIAEVARLSERARLEAGKTQSSTNAISTKTADLVRAHVTAVVRDRFTRETERLRLDKVTINDIGVRKGALRHQAAFIGARQEAPLPRVLSEGEQTALGLAGFFTEAYLDTSRAALILDDPVCSLDHRRRVKVAERLAEFAADRQVIVFTHDIVFVGDLTKAAEAAQIAVTERSVEREGSGKPGACREHHPWKARDAGQRLNDLAKDLARMKADRASLDEETYETRTAEWAGKLSETWERILVLEVVGQVFDLGTQEVRPRKFRLLAKITDTDDADFQASYGRVSQWARRHDKSTAVNYVAPSTDEMQAELDLVKAWFERVRKYKN